MKDKPLAKGGTGGVVSLTIPPRRSQITIDLMHFSISCPWKVFCPLEFIFGTLSGYGPDEGKQSMFGECTHKLKI